MNQLNKNKEQQKDYSILLLMTAIWKDTEPEEKNFWTAFKKKISGLEWNKRSRTCSGKNLRIDLLLYRPRQLPSMACSANCSCSKRSKRSCLKIYSKTVSITKRKKLENPITQVPFISTARAETFTAQSIPTQSRTKL